MTALAEAFEKSGYNTAEDELYAMAVECIRVLGDQGHVERAAALLRDRASEFPRLQREIWRQYISMVKADMHGSDFEFGGRRRNSLPAYDNEGQISNVGEAISPVPYSSPMRDGADQTVYADEAEPFMLAPVAHGPSPSKATLNIARSIANQAAITILDTILIDGKPLGDWTFGECQELGAAHVRNGHILLAIGRHYANIDPRERVRDHMKIEEVQKIVQAAAETADAT